MNNPTFGNNSRPFILFVRDLNARFVKHITASIMSRDLSYIAPWDFRWTVSTRVRIVSCDFCPGQTLEIRKGL